jgi:hypothetical protein
VEEISALRRGDLVPTRDRPAAVEAMLDLFLEKHAARKDTATERKLRAQSKHARAEFGDRHPDVLCRVELEDRGETLSPGSRHDVFRAFRQALAWAVTRSYATRDATVGIPNPKRKAPRAPLRLSVRVMGGCRGGRRRA